MRVRLRYFAMVRELLDKSVEDREVAPQTTAGDLFDQLVAESPRLEALRGSVLLMVNQSYASLDHILADGDELALIPPVSGGSVDAGDEHRYLVTEQPLSPRVVEAIVASPGAGAIVTFTGTVRNNARGRDVVALEYEAYPGAAEKFLAEIEATSGNDGESRQSRSSTGQGT